MRGARAALPDLADLASDRTAQPIDPDRGAVINAERRRILRKGGYGLGGLAAAGLLTTAFGTAISSIVAQPVSASTPLDIQILQTAASLENLAVATYKAALTLPFISGQPLLNKFATTTMMQHDAHSDAFNAQTKSLGGPEQHDPNPKYLQVVNKAKPTLTDAGKVVALAMSLEKVATDTYLNDLAMLDHVEIRSLMASVMGVESQHLATLRAVGALIAGGASDLLTLPTNVAKLPAAAGNVSFPEPFENPTAASPASEGAVK